MPRTAQTAVLLKRIAKDHSVVVVEHDMCSSATSTSASPACTRALVLASGTLDQVSANERVVEVYLGR